jgi:L,D-peptidoglycan transpeptidase YkuD (ErfK/YbiS/YcfS/YnhG family)
VHPPRRQLFLVAFVLGASLALSLPAAHATVRPRAARSCGATLASDVAGVGAARQLITVQVATRRATTAVVELWQRSGAAACFRRVAGPFPANVGANGTSTEHREGDDTTPVGLFGFAAAIYGIDPNPGVHYPYHRLVCGDWWDEDPASPSYNRFVHTPCTAQPSFGPKSEALWRIAPFYDWMAVIDYNTAPIVPGRGSGIFLHVTVGQPTAGCVALPAPDLLQTLRWLEPASRPLIAIGTAGQLGAR